MVYYINIFLEIILAMILLYGRLDAPQLFTQKVMSSERKKWYCILSGVLWILISGLRGLSVGADTFAYYYSYLKVENMSFSELFQNVFAKIVSNTSNKDPGYDFFVKLTQIVSEDYQVFLMIVALIFMIPFIIWVWSESKNPLISFVLYSSLFYAFFAITGIRQTISTALVVLVGDRLIKKRKLISFLIVAFVAALIHMSSLVFVPFYFLSRFKIRQKTVIMAGVACATSFVFKNQLKSIFISISGYEDYSATYTGAGTSTFTILLLMLFILSIFAYRRDEYIEENQRFYIALYLAMFFVPLTWLNPSAMRIVQYFSIYLVLLIPEMIEAVFSEQNKTIVTGVVVCLLVVFLFKSNPTYVFYWQ